jgi:2-oxo-4-hydroxy-4-carboxy-5-ureidoimidazoline decarboxylase
VADLSATSGLTAGVASGGVAPGVVRLNGLSADDATAVLRHCCPSDTWAASLEGERPFADPAALMVRARSLLRALDPEALRAALRSYQPIGADFTGTDRSSSWSRTEERDVAQSSVPIQRGLREAAARYQRRFGYTFVTAAAGRSGSDILEELTTRLTKEPIVELETARAQVEVICQARLLRLLAALAEEP